MSRSRRALALIATLAAGTWLADAQDVAGRRGFSVSIVEPESGGIVAGRTRLRAEVRIDDPADIERVDFFVDDELVFSDAEPPWQVVHDFGRESGVHVVRVIARHRDDVTVSDFVITRALEPQAYVNVQRVLLNVSVRDDDKRLVKGLGLEDFSVYEGGRLQILRSVGLEQRPLLVGILLDSSGSMRGERLEQAQQAACEFVETLEERDRAFVIDFDDQVFLIQQPTGDKQALCAAARSTQAIGNTSIYDAINAAYRVSHDAEAERRALVVLTDGDDSSSSVEIDELMLTAELSEVTVYAIGLDVGAFGDGRRELGRLANATGGRAFFVKRAEQLAGTYGAIAEELRSLYQLVYASDNEQLDGRFIELKVEVLAPGRFDVRHRSGYYAVSPDEEP